MSQIDVKNVPMKYRPIPFWSWNEKLETAETAEQVCKMHDVGIGGFFMHARGGLQTEYMGEEWFENVEAAVKQAEELGMRPWAYDENGWPSGFGSGKVNGLGIAYQQKYLRMEKKPEHTEHTIGKSGEHYFYYDVNPFYVDTLDKDVVKAFIESTYEPYYQRFGNRIEGFFTDEPQISRNGIPWSFVFEEEYQKKYQENLLEHLEELFLPVGDYKKTRIRFWKMVTDLFSDAFMKQIYDWCEAHGLKLTGHLVLEETLECQLESNGACMPHYEYFHIPGMDWLGRPIFDCLTAKQVSSVAQQLGKEAVLSETFALCGHNVSMAELKGIYEWQMVRGINLLCPHLQGYSNRGIRKRDYPPAMYIQQPWWAEYDKWVDAMAREGMLLTEGEAKAEILLLHPQTTAWTLYDNGKNKGLEQLNDSFLSLMTRLEEKHVEYHLGDETLLERHGKAENGKLILGKQSYSYVITEGCQHLLDSTKALLKQYEAQGGNIVTAEEILADPVTADEKITYTKRFLEEGILHFFVNSSPEEKSVPIGVQGKKLDIYTGEWNVFDGVHTFEPWGSLMILQDGTENTKHVPYEEELIRPEGIFAVAEDTMNVLTLDKCDYYFDGVLQEKNGYILNVCERANALERKVALQMDFSVEVAVIPKVLYLVTETPQHFVITINGQEIHKTDAGYFRDKSFRKIDIAKYIQTGKNVIRYTCDLVQSEAFYRNRKNAMIFESELNKLVYDMEIEAIYLLGSFGVKTDGKWEPLKKNACRYKGNFVLEEPVREVSLKNLEKQGFPFFCGELKVTGEIEVRGEHPVLLLDLKGVNAVRVEIEDLKITKLTDHKVSLAGIPEGKHTITLTLINNLRNMLGPHHLQEGESHGVGPGSFFKEPCVWRKQIPKGFWNDDYCFVELG